MVFFFSFFDKNVHINMNFSRKYGTIFIKRSVPARNLETGRDIQKGGMQEIPIPKKALLKECSTFFLALFF